MAASLRGREPRSRGASTVVSERFSCVKLVAEARGQRGNTEEGNVPRWKPLPASG
jgi:hypothetical protein